MSDERDDEILGRALARAIETQDPNETPYEASRLAVRPLRRGLPIWRFAGVAAALVLAIAFGSWLMRPLESTPAAASPAISPSVPTVAPTSAPASAIPTTAPTNVDHNVVYFARDGLPPMGLHFIGGGDQATAAERIAGRLTVLARNADLSKFADHDRVPPGTRNVFPTTSQIGVASDAAVKVAGDLATVDFTVPQSDWKVRGAAESLALLRQLVYTATEEPGITRVLITENGGKPTRIDQLAIDRPLSREDVFGYMTTGPIGADHAISSAGPALPSSGQRGTSTEIITGTRVRFSFEVGTSGSSSTPPAFVATMTPARDDFAQLGKYVLGIVVGSNAIPGTWASGRLTIHDQTPLRAVFGGDAGGTVAYQLLLDDARPWRAYTDGGKVVVEVGGDPRAVSDRIAIALTGSVGPDLTVGRSFPLAGAARTSEGNVVWRAKDSSQRVVASGHTTATLGTSLVWGTFSTQITLPQSVGGNVTLEVYEVSPKDGTEQGLVAIPFVVR